MLVAAMSCDGSYVEQSVMQIFWLPIETKVKVYHKLKQTSLTTRPTTLGLLADVGKLVIDQMGEAYPELIERQNVILNLIQKEV